MSKVRYILLLLERGVEVGIEDQSINFDTDFKYVRKFTKGVLLWPGELMIQHCQCCGAGLIPGQGPFTCCGHGQKSISSHTFLHSTAFIYINADGRYFEMLNII